MATYSAITDAEIAPEKFVTTGLMHKLRDNLEATIEGDASAPPIAYSALSPAVVTGGTAYNLTGPVGGVSSSASYTKEIEWQLGIEGSVNVYFELYGAGTGSDAYAKIYKNGVSAGTERHVHGTTPAAFSENIAVAGGDLIQIYVKVAIPGIDTAYVTKARLRDANFIPGSIVRNIGTDSSI